MQYGVWTGTCHLGQAPWHLSMRRPRVAKGTSRAGCGTTRGKGAEGADPLGVCGGAGQSDVVWSPAVPERAQYGQRSSHKPRGTRVGFARLLRPAAREEQVKGAAVCVGSAPGAPPRDNSHSASREISRECDGGWDRFFRRSAHCEMASGSGSQKRYNAAEG